MATNETSARPIISAAAVEAVRPGLRTAFSRARRPGTPRKRSTGRPTSEAIGRTSLRAEQRHADEHRARSHAHPGLARA